MSICICELTHFARVHCTYRCAIYDNHDGSHSCDACPYVCSITQNLTIIHPNCLHTIRAERLL